MAQVVVAAGAAAIGIPAAASDDDQAGGQDRTSGLGFLLAGRQLALVSMWDESGLCIDTGSLSWHAPVMPRPLRIEFEGAIYPVMNRGDRREPIFRDEADRERFFETLGEACAKTDWR